MSDKNKGLSKLQTFFGYYGLYVLFKYTVTNLKRIYNRLTQSLSHYKVTNFIGEIINYAVITNAHTLKSLQIVHDLMNKGYTIVLIDDNKHEKDLLRCKERIITAYNDESKVKVITYPDEILSDDKKSQVEVLLKEILSNSKIGILVNLSPDVNMASLSMHVVFFDIAKKMFIQALFTRIILSNMIASRGKSLIVGIWNNNRSMLYYFFKSLHNNIRNEYEGKIDSVMISNFNHRFTSLDRVDLYRKNIYS